MDNNVIEYKSLEMRLFGNDTVNSVSLREIYLDLGYDEKNFTEWSKRNLLKDFEENSDFKLLLLEKESHSLGLQDGYTKPKTDYLVTLDTAKELAMMSKKPKGKLIRKYFIEVEKVARSRPQQISKADVYMKIVAQNEAIIEMNKSIVKSLQDDTKAIQAPVTTQTPEVIEAIEYIEEKASEARTAKSYNHNTKSKYYKLKVTPMYKLKAINPKDYVLTFDYYNEHTCIITNKKGISWKINSPKWVKDMEEFSTFKAKVTYRRSTRGRAGYLDLIGRV